MLTIIYRKIDLRCVGSVMNNMTVEQEIELNVIPNFGGNIEDYSFIETDKTNFHLEQNKEGNVIAVDNIIEPTIVENTPSKAEIVFAEYVLSTEERILNLESKILGGN